MKNVFHSVDSGSVLTVPREGGMVRVYTQMGDLEAGKRLDRSDFSLEQLLEKTRKVVAPYEMDVKYVDWFTCYEVGSVPNCVQKLAANANPCRSANAFATHSRNSMSTSSLLETLATLTVPKLDKA